AERANGRVLVWGPHWAVRLYGESSERARADPGKGKARRSGGRCGGLSRLLPARRPQTPRFASPSGREARARLRRGQWAVRPIFATRTEHARASERSGRAGSAHASLTLP